MDTSGSTYGQTLEAGIAAIQELAPFLNVKPSQPMPLPCDAVVLNCLKSGGGTDPSCLHRN
jgi:hypothetical protein